MAPAILPSASAFNLVLLIAIRADEAKECFLPIAISFAKIAKYAFRPLSRLAEARNTAPLKMSAVRS